MFITLSSVFHRTSTKLVQWSPLTGGLSKQVLQHGVSIIRTAANFVVSYDTFLFLQMYMYTRMYNTGLSFEQQISMPQLLMQLVAIRFHP